MTARSQDTWSTAATGSIRRIGSGGMADVWLRRRRPSSTADVALKFLHENFAQRPAVRRALPPRGVCGGRAAAPERRRRLRPRRARGPATSSSMEFVEGASLQGSDHPRALEPARLSRSCARCSPEPSFAHERGIVHRDLKPHERADRPRGPRPGHRLRHRPRRGVGDHPDRLGAGHGAVPLARAGAGAGGDRRPPTSTRSA